MIGMDGFIVISLHNIVSSSDIIGCENIKIKCAKILTIGQIYLPTKTWRFFHGLAHGFIVGCPLKDCTSRR